MCTAHFPTFSGSPPAVRGEICFACSGRDYAPSVFRLQGNFFFEGKHLFKREFCYL